MGLRIGLMPMSPNITEVPTFVKPVLESMTKLPAVPRSTADAVASKMAHRMELNPTIGIERFFTGFSTRNKTRRIAAVHSRSMQRFMLSRCQEGEHKWDLFPNLGLSFPEIFL